MPLGECKTCTPAGVCQANSEGYFSCESDAVASARHSLVSQTAHNMHWFSRHPNGPDMLNRAASICHASEARVK